MRWTSAGMAAPAVRDATFAHSTTTCSIWTFFSAGCAIAAQEGPVFLMGNSMGGLIAALWAIRRKPRLAGIILSGPLLALLNEVAPMLRHLASLAAYLWPTLRVVRVPIHLLSRNRQAVESYRNDPHFSRRPVTARCAEILAALGHLPRRGPVARCAAAYSARKRGSTMRRRRQSYALRKSGQQGQNAPHLRWTVPRSL